MPKLVYKIISLESFFFFQLAAASKYFAVYGLCYSYAPINIMPHHPPPGR